MCFLNSRVLHAPPRASPTNRARQACGRRHARACVARGRQTRPLALPFPPFENMLHCLRQRQPNGESQIPRRYSQAPRTAIASGTPKAKLEPRDDTGSFRALLAPATAQRRNSNPARKSSALLAPAAAQRRISNPAATLEGSAHCWRQRQPNGETRTPRRHSSLPRIANASGNQTAKLKPRCDTYSVCALLAPAGAQCRTRTRTLSKAPLDRGVGGVETLNPKRLHCGWSGAGMQSSERARLGRRSPPTLLVRGGSQPARAFAQAGPKP